jgi:tRNA uridine 5-carbamoylmethylation protein Kti12
MLQVPKSPALMPLVIVCGLPASGKTTLTKKLAAFLQENTQMAVQVINDEFLRIDNNSYFSSKRSSLFYEALFDCTL